MSHWHTRTEHWLSIEQDEQSASEDDALTAVFTALPTIVPREDFVRRSVRAAWSARAHRQRTLAFAVIAASVLVAASLGAAPYVLAVGIVAIGGLTLVARLAAVAGGSLLGTPLTALGLIVEYAAWTVGFGAAIIALYETQTRFGSRRAAPVTQVAESSADQTAQS
jgi:hypothetical protein